MHGIPATPVRLPPVPRAIRASALMKGGGYAIYDHLPGAGTCARLLAESRLYLHVAVASAVATSDDEEVRGGNPARRFISAGGGDEQAALYRDQKMASFLASLCNAPVRPTGASGTYTYYARPGDHLALHRDIETCDIAVVSVRLPVGSTMVIFGGLVPHLIEPLAPGELRIVSILCFRVRPG